MIRDARIAFLGFLIVLLAAAAVVLLISGRSLDFTATLFSVITASVGLLAVGLTNNVPWLSSVGGPTHTPVPASGQVSGAEADLSQLSERILRAKTILVVGSGFVDSVLANKELAQFLRRPGSQVRFLLPKGRTAVSTFEQRRLTRTLEAVVDRRLLQRDSHKIEARAASVNLSAVVFDELSVWLEISLGEGIRPTYMALDVRESGFSADLIERINQLWSISIDVPIDPTAKL